MAKKEMKDWVKVLYTIFLALLIALFYGLGVAAFYPSPKAPETPVSIGKVEPAQMTAEEKQASLDFEQANQKYNVEMQTYNRNVSMITLVLAVVSLVVSLLLIGGVQIISDALLLGAGFTLIYSIGLGLATGDARYRFIIVSVGLGITLIVGYLKFIRQREEK